MTLASARDARTATSREEVARVGLLGLLMGMTKVSLVFYSEFS